MGAQVARSTTHKTQNEDEAEREREGTVQDERRDDDKPARIGVERDAFLPSARAGGLGSVGRALYIPHVIFAMHYVII